MVVEDKSIKPEGSNIIKNDIILTASFDPNLPNMTVVFPSDLYQKFITDTDKLYMVKYPLLNHKNILRMSSINMIESDLQKRCCIVSSDIFRLFGLDFAYDTIYIVYGAYQK